MDYNGYFRPYLFNEGSHVYNNVIFDYKRKDTEGVIYIAKLLNVAAKSADRQGGP